MDWSAIERKPWMQTWRPLRHSPGSVPCVWLRPEPLFSDHLSRNVNQSHVKQGHQRTQRGMLHLQKLNRIADCGMPNRTQHDAKEKDSWDSLDLSIAQPYLWLRLLSECQRGWLWQICPNKYKCSARLKILIINSDSGEGFFFYSGHPRWLILDNCFHPVWAAPIDCHLDWPFQICA